MSHVRTTLARHHQHHPHFRGGLHTPDLLGREPSVVHHIHGNCVTPSLIERTKDGLHATDLLVRCRHCTNCRNSRRQFWTLRAMEEITKHPRTWFWTGTFRNQTHDIEEVNRELTLFLKRLRKNHGSFRYLAVPERHKSGAFHLHALIHCHSTFRHKYFASPWKAGYQNAKLANLGSARYVTKYITKDLTEIWGRTARPRIRSSHHYGSNVRDSEHFKEIHECPTCLDPKAELHSLTVKLRELIEADWVSAQTRPDYNPPQ